MKTIDLYNIIQDTALLRRVYITLELYCVAILAIILMCMLLKPDRKQGFNHFLIINVACAVLVLVFDALGVHFESSPSIFAPVLVQMFNLLVFTFNYAVIAGFTIYLVSFLRERTELPRWFLPAALAICLGAVVMVMVLQIFGLYFYVDEQGVYHRGAMYVVSAGLGAVVLAMDFWAILFYRRFFSRRERVTFVLYEVLPLLAIVLQSVIYGLPLMGVAMTLSMLILYSGIQVEQSRLLEKKEVELSNNRISIMLSQIQPHFLYNALTAIAMLCDVSPREAKEAIIEFSVYLRGNMDSLKQKTLIPFEKELKHTEVYIKLEKMRFGDDLRVAYDVQCRNFVMPALTMQPIVENAVKYGVGQKEEGGTVTIATRETDLDYRIIISDDGVGYDLSKPQYDGRTHIGTENVQKRLLAQCGGRLEIESVRGEGTTASIIIPKKGENAI